MLEGIVLEIRTRFTGIRSNYTFPHTFFLQNECISCPDRHRVVRSVPKGAYSVLVGRPDTKRQLRRRRLRQEDNIKVNLKELGWGGI